MANKPPKTPITKKKLTLVLENKTSIIKGTPLNYNAAIEAKYYKAISSLVKQMTSQSQREIKKLFNADHAKAFYGEDADIASQARILTNKLQSKFEQLFGWKAKIMAENMVKNSDKASSSTLHASLKSMSGGLSLPTTAITPQMKTILKAATAENVSLIKSIPSEYFTQIQGVVMRSITHGNGLQDIMPALQKYEGVTLRRARNIAEDQTRKTYNNLNRGRMQAVGVKKFEWLHTGGSQHPRQDHIEMSGKIYSFDNLPVIDKNTGERGIPAQAINCRCRMLPVIVFDEGKNKDGN